MLAREPGTIEASPQLCLILELHLDRETSSYCVPRGNRLDILEPFKDECGDFSSAITLENMNRRLGIIEPGEVCILGVSGVYKDFIR